MRDKIIKSAQELFARYGYKKTTMDDIAGASGKVKSAVYYYFKNKEEVLGAVANLEIEKGIEKLVKAVNSEKSAEGKIAAYIRARIYAKQSIASFYRFLPEEYFEQYEFISKIRIELDKRERAVISGILKKGIKEEAFGVKDVALTTRTILNILKGLEHYYFKKRNNKKLQEEIDSIIGVFLLGLLKR
ncbi:MAG: TetR/AcrR family transcriptional regulator [Candidatus Omnitrophica bacterium]|nr:TetR/AcrR family transcriptional regulator [Candidatus Omnitrophota bacterium]